MRDSQKQTIARYHSFLHTQAISAALKAARETGLVDVLRDGQRELDELAEQCSCDSAAIANLLRVLIAIGLVEHYGEFFALSQAARLMIGPDTDMGAEVYRDLSAFMRSGEGTGSIDEYRRRISARQWTHTGAAVQAAEVLRIGPPEASESNTVEPEGSGSQRRRGLKVLELGSGAGVWSAALAYRDPTLTVTAVDDGLSLHHCRQTYDSIDLLSRLTTIDDDYRTWDVPLGEFDLVVIPEILQLESDADAVILLGRACDALRVGGEIVILETLNEADGPRLPLATQAFELAIAAQSGRQRTASQIQQLLRGAGFADGQWGWLTASPLGIGLILARKETQPE
ncbi:MAG: methyltransferase [Pirellulales bacterium]